MKTKHFEDFLRLLPSRAESELSWTVDLDARKRVAAEEAGPLKRQATANGQQAAQWSQDNDAVDAGQPVIAEGVQCTASRKTKVALRELGLRDTFEDES